MPNPPSLSALPPSNFCFHHSTDSPSTHSLQDHGGSKCKQHQQQRRLIPLPLLFLPTAPPACHPNQFAARDSRLRLRSGPFCEFCMQSNQSNSIIQVLIPTATILGNCLVIVSVLRFKALHSAINFLILGLAIADLMVAIFVMPYAVYVYVSDSIQTKKKHSG